MASIAQLSAFCSNQESIVVTKDMLQRVSVIGQVDSKFIASVYKQGSKRCLILFDQHAVDERLRLEQLQMKCKPDLLNIKRGKLSDPLVFTIYVGEMGNTPKTELRELEAGLLSSGICCSLVPQHKKLSVTITEAPFLLLKKILRVTSQTEYLHYVQEAVRKIVLNQLNDKGRPSFGSLVNHLLAAEACARAIKFGEVLTYCTMTNMLSQLAKCDLPFQCAHGRPTLTVINYDLSGHSYLKRSAPKENLGKAKYRRHP